MPTNSDIAAVPYNSRLQGTLLARPSIAIVKMPTIRQFAAPTRIGISGVRTQAPLQIATKMQLACAGFQSRFGNEVLEARHASISQRTSAGRMPMSIVIVMIARPSSPQLSLIGRGLVMIHQSKAYNGTVAAMAQGYDSQGVNRSIAKTSKTMPKTSIPNATADF